MAKTPVAELAPVYLLYGAEKTRIERQIASFRARMARIADMDYNLREFDLKPPSGDVEEVLIACDTLPFLAERQMVVARNVDHLDGDARERLLQYLEDPAPQTVLVLVAERVAKNSRLYKAVQKVGAVHEFAQLKRGEYPREVMRMFEARGKKVDTAAAAALVEAVGQDLQALQTEVDKIVLHAGAKKRLVKQDILYVVSKTSPTSIFSILDAVGERDTEEALRRLAAFLAEGESEHRAHYMLVAHVRDLIRAKSLVARGDSEGEVAAALGKSPWVAGKAMKQSSMFEMDELTRALRLAADLEERMKTGRMDARLAVERWVISLCEGV